MISREVNFGMKNSLFQLSIRLLVCLNQESLMAINPFALGKAKLYIIMAFVSAIGLEERA